VRFCHSALAALPCGIAKPVEELEQMDAIVAIPWALDWVWSLPLIVISVLIHVVGLMLIFRGAIHVMSTALVRRCFTLMFVASIGVATLLATILHGFEGGIWAASYRFLGALPDRRSAMLYSLSAMTTYGHENLHLEERWQLMGAFEALSGTLLFGLTTAFLFAMIREVWKIQSAERQRKSNAGTARTE
jgi:hypothetical protein